MPWGRASRPASSLPLTGSNALAHVARAPDVGLPAIGQADEGRHARIVRAAELGGDRAHRRIAAAVVAVVGAAGQRIAGLHRDRRVVAGRAIDRADDRQLVHDRAPAAADARRPGRRAPWSRSARYGPRISCGASGLGSHMSMWLGPPESQNRIDGLFDRECRVGVGGGQGRMPQAYRPASGRPGPQAGLQEPAPRADANQVATRRQHGIAGRAAQVRKGVRRNSAGVGHERETPRRREVRQTTAGT